MGRDEKRREERKETRTEKKGRKPLEEKRREMK